MSAWGKGSHAWLAIGVVEESRDQTLQPGDVLHGLLGWQNYAVMPAGDLTKLPKIPGMPATACFGLFGHIGFTAYFGLASGGGRR
ncbi:MAG: hypothetical protein ACKV22_00405, partial [Bryobacteraceae bacterium]